jgi:hypothetical protein
MVVGRSRLRVDQASLAEAAVSFAARHVLHLPGFLDPALLALVAGGLPKARFTPRLDTHGVELEETLDDEPLMGSFVVTLNDPALFAAVERITGCDQIGCFAGRVYRRRRSSGPGHYYPWHDDVAFGRLVGLSVNLSPEPYDGGLLQMRDAKTGVIIAEASNPIVGDALLFRISPQFEHQVTPVTSGGTRTVLAGWFCSHPDYASVVAQTQPVTY